MLILFKIFLCAYTIRIFATFLTIFRNPSAAPTNVYTPAKGNVYTPALLPPILLKKEVPFGKGTSWFF